MTVRKVIDGTEMKQLGAILVPFGQSLEFEDAFDEVRDGLAALSTLIHVFPHNDLCLPASVGVLVEMMSRRADDLHKMVFAAVPAAPAAPADPSDPT